MATSNMKAFNNKFIKDVGVNMDRAVFLMDCETGTPTANEKLAANYINELAESVAYLENRIKGRE